MNQHTKEAISALIDGELTPKDTSETVSHLLKSDDFCKVWNRYHLIGDVLRGEHVRVVYQDIAVRVSKQVREETTIIAPHRVAPHKQIRGLFDHRWVKPTVGFALAASVAVMAIMITPYFLDLAPDGEVPEVALSPKSMDYTGHSGTRWNVDKPDMESTLNRYLVNHQKYAPLKNMNGPYANFVSYDTRP